MSFYTSPALKNAESLVSVMNTSNESASVETSVTLDIDEASMSSVKSVGASSVIMSDVSGSVYVSSKN